MSNEDLVTVYTVKDPTQAELIRMALEGEGIAAHLDGEGQGGGGLIGIFDTHVVVRASDAERARAMARVGSDPAQRSASAAAVDRPPVAAAIAARVALSGSARDSSTLQARLASSFKFPNLTSDS